ncbi:hypothetical protein [Hyalangium sp.]|uniref:hypothetical protein n=1 Tax=Hyalangium sp. TaxID=2028555 RepID=UPI002D54445D|nr:hypothetical protein [Hyalangium sp.]HYI02303.1 hypothetical protein [Hyalangium sp.]
MSAVNAARSYIASYNPQMSSTQRAYLAELPPEQKKVEELKMKLEQEQQLVSFISNMMRKLHDMNMAVINNMR